MKKKILLADDEEIIRQGISTLIPWETLDMELVYIAENGKKALMYMENNPVDIVITDIRMPLLDGLELIKACSAQKLCSRFILLTGYSEFEYAKSAMQYGVRHYLLKPTDESQIIAALRELGSEFDRSYSRSKLFHRLVEKTPSILLQEIISQEEATPAKDLPSPDAVDKIKSVVSRELDNPDLSLKWIAQNRLYMNENYLSRLFQKKTGCKFSTWLTEQRMEHARKLLLSNPDIKLSELCARTGFVNNPAYFSTLFKNYCGCTLTQYRQRLISKK